ncbi:branched-chain amino acid ABC transporter permease [Nocardioides sp.]|uniref:branched-chain amino acid ABC transporter permease n=1 Tax=Nocardioides sp. TaxID=35761 RepID=UPI0026345B00|nr:branched-chain amino acid ABC transporter permease [Nocardioides sp.]MDI6912496.1 branched-chain amino acid ABC transporter permease [Nocardioides sp.]
MPLLGIDEYNIKLLTDAVITSLGALAVGFLLRQTGLLSLGHALFFGSAGYLVGISVRSWALPLLLAIGLALLAAVVLGLVVGALSVRLSGIGFAMLTLVFGQAALVWMTSTRLREHAGGQDGVRLPYSTELLGVSLSELQDPRIMWPVAWLTLLLALAGIILIRRSRFGLILEAMRENADRAPYIGLSVNTPRILAFAFTALLAGAAGILHVLHRGFIAPEALHWSTSGEFLIQSLIGGIGTTLGPAVGAVVLVALEEVVTGFSERWPTVLGLLLIAVLVFFPGGISEGATRAWRWIRRAA